MCRVHIPLNHLGLKLEGDKKGDSTYIDTSAGYVSCKVDDASVRQNIQRGFESFQPNEMVTVNVAQETSQGRALAWYGPEPINAYVRKFHHLSTKCRHRGVCSSLDID